MSDKFGLIGFPLGHSFSKKYFTDKFTTEGIDASYELFPIVEVTELSDLIKTQPDLKGLNVTIPHKRAVINLLDVVSSEASTINAVNTISIKIVDGRKFLKGWNTDAPAFESELVNFTGSKPSTAIVLGTGGAAAAVKYVLNKLGWKYKSASRTPRNPDEVSYTELTSDIIYTTRLIVNTTPLGMFPDIETAPPIPYNLLNENHYLFDLVYNPVETRFMSLGRTHGAKVINGLGMLHKQAELAWKIWKSELSTNQTV